MKQLAPLQLKPSDKDDRFSSIDPLDVRYFDSEVSQYLSERSRVSYQAYMEAALAQALADVGICSREVADEIDSAVRRIDIAAVYEEELVTKHDVKALVNCIKAQLSEEAKPFVHFGATSYDIVSSAMALQMRAAMDEVVIPRLKTLLKTLIEMADRYADTVQIGRTHGQHAVPVTFGFVIAGYVSRLGETTQALEALTKELPGKFSGAVGAYNALSVFVDDPFAFEESVLGYVGLKPASYSSQIVPSEYMIRLLDELAITAGIMANVSHDMRHLQRSEIAEVREKFEKGQTGSSTMAHKRNPWNFENVISMSKQVTAQIVNANMNISSEHQRDLTDSASARFYVISLASVASMTRRLNNVMGKLEVDEDNMQKNLKLSGGAIAAEPLYLLLEKYGHTTAHEVSKALAHQALESGVSLYDALSSSADLADYLEKFSHAERNLIQYPETHYTGVAAERTRRITSIWKKRLF